MTPLPERDQSYDLVRVSREMVEHLIADESEPAVIVRLDRQDDGTCEMVLKTTDVIAEVKRLREALTWIAVAHPKTDPKQIATDALTGDGS